MLGAVFVFGHHNIREYLLNNYALNAFEFGHARPGADFPL